MTTTFSENAATNASNRDTIRTLVRGGYDLQKLRIQMGNRIVANFKARLGQAPSTPESDLDEAEQDVVKDIRTHYRKIMDALKDKFPKPRDFTGDEVIASFTELCIIQSYMEIEASEKANFKRVELALSDFPIYTEYLDHVRGIGPMMAGVIVSEFDIKRSKYPSSMWRYAGLDVVTAWHLQSTTVTVNNMAKRAEDLSLPMELTALEHDNEASAEIAKYGGRVADRHFTDDAPARTPEGEWLPINQEAVVLYSVEGFQVRAVYRLFNSGGRSRRKNHLVDRQYADSNGDMQTRVSITFNPWLKTKLIGVLATSFIKSNSPWRKTYDDYKYRMENHATWGTHNDKSKDVRTSKGRRDAMAKRYMVKMFLIELYNKWRAIEGLEVHPPYCEAKLGIKHGAA